jgi:uncharacterized protein YaaN involved in tellurite resistance
MQPIASVAAREYKLERMIAMSDEMNSTPVTPSLTLDPFADGAAAAAEAPKAPNVTLTAESGDKQETTEALTLEGLSPEEQETVKKFAESIDITDTKTVMQYGAAAQQKIAGFSDSALENVRTKDFGETGDMISSLVAQLKGFDAEDKKGFLGIFKKTGRSIEAMKAKYAKVESNVDTIVNTLNDHQITLLKDIALLDKMYEMNLTYQKELTMYIIAGKLRLEQDRATTLVELRDKAAKSGLPEDAQAADDYASMCDRFEKKLYDLELTRVISVQMAPQIRLVQNNDALMSEKIQSTVVNTIPLWKSQMVIGLGIAHSQQAMEAQSAVTNMTNDLLKKNAEALHTGTVSIAKESERGVVDIETLTATNKELIATLDEVKQIQNEGREKRRAAEAELTRIENELKDKLLEIRS